MLVGEMLRHPVTIFRNRKKGARRSEIFVCVQGEILGIDLLGSLPMAAKELGN